MKKTIKSDIHEFNTYALFRQTRDIDTANNKYVRKSNGITDSDI